ncbi:MAG: phosphatidylinositol kinase [Ignavibacteriales bacterium]|nr:MAG: phosphatidylinositol kinase [Ignavibacteriales bacterium]
MKKQAEIYYNNELAGYLIYTNQEYIFQYDEKYFNDGTKPSISLSLPKTELEHRSKILFPFFFGLLAEGDQKYLQCRKLKIDENDHFTRLIKTASNTIGAISVKEVI